VGPENSYEQITYATNLGASWSQDPIKATVLPIVFASAKCVAGLQPLLLALTHDKVHSFYTHSSKFENHMNDMLSG
jgi:hypothetical protein